MKNVLYIKTNSRASRNVEAWLKRNEVDYVKRNVINDPPSVEELMKMLRYTNKGIEDIILEESELIKGLGSEMNSLSLKEMLRFLNQNPGAIKVPLLFTENHFIRGYNEYDLRNVLPRHKKLELRAAIYKSLEKGVPYESTIGL